MEGERRAAVVIIGGGYSGTMMAAELARRGVASTLVDGSGREGRGTAYSTSEDAHLLNVMAERMGAWADRPDDFAQAVAADGHGPHDFVPRPRYGEYLSKILHEAVASGHVTLAQSDARTAERGAAGWVVELADGSRIAARALVLAQGNQSPAAPTYARGIAGELFVNDPWSGQGRAAIRAAAAAGGDVLLIGTGLTMVDVVLSLDEARHRGRIVALSRRGLAPRAHAEHDSISVDDPPQGSVVQLLRWLRSQGGALGWRAVMDAVRPLNQRLWQGLNREQQRRFLRHARPWWDVHRHRIAPEVAGRIKRLVELGQLELVAGRVTDMWAGNPRLGVAIQRRGKAEAVEHQFALAVNCTGPLGSISASQDPLLGGLFEAGLARADSLNLGLEVCERSRIEGTDRAWAVGPLTKGRFWEITAVPDIRGQVAAVADDIAEEVKP